MSDSPRSIPTRISSRSSSLNESGRAVRVRNTTTASSLIRRRNVDTEIPADAAASARPTPLATAVNAGATTDRGNLAAPIRHLPDRSCRAHPLSPPSISRTWVTRSARKGRMALLAMDVADA